MAQIIGKPKTNAFFPVLGRGTNARKLTADGREKGVTAIFALYMCHIKLLA